MGKISAKTARLDVLNVENRIYDIHARNCMCFIIFVIYSGRDVLSVNVSHQLISIVRRFLS